MYLAGFFGQVSRRWASETGRSFAFPDDKRRLMDMRRSGVIEAVAGGAGPLGLAAKLANSQILVTISVELPSPPGKTRECASCCSGYGWFTQFRYAI